MGRRTRKTKVDRVFAPLFPPQSVVSGIYADEIKELKIYRQESVSGMVRRRLVPRSKYTLLSGEEFEYNPFETEESDIEKFFGTGEFYLQPIGHDLKLLPGRSLCIGVGPAAAAERDQLLEKLEASERKVTSLAGETTELGKKLERTQSYLDSKSKALELCYKRESEDQKRHRDELKKLRDHLQATVVKMVETREAIVRHAMDPADGVLTLAQIRDGIDKSITKELLADAFQSAWSTDTMSLILGVGGVLLGMAYLMYGAKSAVASAPAAPATPAAPAPEGGP